MKPMRYFLLFIGLIYFQNILCQSVFDNLIGNWRCDAFNGELYTEWAKDGAGNYLAVGKYVENGDTVYREHLLLFELNDRKLLAVTPQDFAPYIFELKKNYKNGAYFENMNHKNPQQVWYELRKDGVFYRKTSGWLKDGSPSLNEYFFKKINE